MRWFMARFYPVMEGARYRRAAEAAEEQPDAWDGGALRKSRQALLVTFKRSGEAVPTPVHCGGSEDGRLFLRSQAPIGQIQPIGHKSTVLVRACHLPRKPPR